jgi:hypothetical protein
MKITELIRGILDGVRQAQYTKEIKSWPYN